MINLTPSPLAAFFGLESPFCSPSVTETDSACALAVPVDSGQAGGIPPLKPVNLFSHFVHPSGCWFVVSGGRCVTLRMTRHHFSNAETRSA